MSQERRPPTSRDVARLAGVSQPTVSRAFDPEARVAPETRRRVLEAAAELGYRPNVIARSLITQRTNIVGVVMANITSSLFYPDVLERLLDRLQAAGKQVLLFNPRPDQPVDDLLPRLLGYRVDGMIIASTTPSREVVEACTTIGTPVVLFNRLPRGPRANAVCCDNVAAGRAVADLIAARGHLRPAYLAGIETTSTNETRERGYTERLAELGFGPPIREVGNYTYESGREAALRLLARDEPPDAIFAAADIMALGALDAARSEMAIRIPDELSIVGFDDIAPAGWPAYGLTTVRQPIDRMIDTALELLRPTGDGVRTGEVRLLEGEIIIRDSVRDAPG